MKNRLFYILSLFVLCTPLGAQELRENINVYYERNYSTVNPDFCDNEQRMKLFADSMQHIISDTTNRVHRVEIISSASPEGYVRKNERLALKRGEAARQFLLKYLHIEDSLFVFESRNDDWGTLAQMVTSESHNIPNRKEVLDIITSTTYDGEEAIDPRNKMLTQYNQGRAWHYMNHHIFPELRIARINVIYTPLATPLTTELSRLSTGATLHTPYRVDAIALVMPERIDLGSLYVKTNVPALGLLMLNAAVEYSFPGDHISINLPIYYSAVDYFSETSNFRIFSIQPEFRYWIPRTGVNNTRGLFVGAHLGISYFNFAWDGEYRYQDHQGTSPAWGGGIGLGYALPLTLNNDWFIELSVGAGVYDIYYDRFYNVHNGKYVDTTRKVYWGLDQLTLSIAYRIDLFKYRKR